MKVGDVETEERRRMCWRSRVSGRAVLVGLIQYVEVHYSASTCLDEGAALEMTSVTGSVSRPGREAAVGQRKRG